jgi:hypothetical protein
LGIGRHLTPTWSLEVNGLWGKFSNDVGGKLGRAQNRRVVMKVIANPNNAVIEGEGPK